MNDKELLTAKIRYDWLATPNGYRGGLNNFGVTSYGAKYPKFGQRTEFSELLTDTWENLKQKTREIAEIEFKPIHPYDGEYISGLVLIEWHDDYKKPYRVCCFRNLCAKDFENEDLPERIARAMGYNI